MKTTLNIGLAIVLAGSVVLKAQDALADQKMIIKSESSWQDDHGQGNQEIQKTDWDKKSGTGTYSSTTTTTDGKTLSQSGTLTANPDGSITQVGTITDPQGESTTVKRKIATNEEDSPAAEIIDTDPDSKILDIDKTILPEDNAGNVTETDSADPDNSGMVTTRKTSTVTTEHSVTEESGGEHPKVDLGGDPLNHNDPNTKDESPAINESISVDQATKDKE